MMSFGCRDQGRDSVCPVLWMSKIKNGGLGQYRGGPFDHQQFGTAGVEVVN